MSRYSVNIFRPPFQSGRTSPEASLSRSDQPLLTEAVSEGPGPEEETLTAGGAGDAQEQSSCASGPETETGKALANSAGDLGAFSMRSSDSGFSEQESSFQDPFREKETSCEKALRPEGNFSAGLAIRPGIPNSVVVLC